MRPSVIASATGDHPVQPAQPRVAPPPAAQVVAQGLGVRRQPLALRRFLPAFCLLALALLVEGAPRLAQEGEQVDRIVAGGVVQPARPVGDLGRGPGPVAGAGQE